MLMSSQRSTCGMLHDSRAMHPKLELLCLAGVQAKTEQSRLWQEPSLCSWCIQQQEVSTMSIMAAVCKHTTGVWSAKTQQQHHQITQIWSGKPLQQHYYTGEPHVGTCFLQYTALAKSKTCVDHKATEGVLHRSVASAQMPCIRRDGRILTACGGSSCPSGLDFLTPLCLLSFWLTVPPSHIGPGAPNRTGCFDPSPYGACATRHRSDCATGCSSHTL